MNGSFEDEESFFDRNLYGVEGALTWRPPERSRYRELVIRGGAMLLEGLAHQDVSEGDGEAKEKEAGAGSAMGFLVVRRAPPLTAVVDRSPLRPGGRS